MPVSTLYLWWLELPPDIAKSILWDKVASGWQHRYVRRLVSPSALSEQEIPGVGCSICLLAWTTEQLQGSPGPPLAVGIHSSSEHLKQRHAHICLLVHADHTLLFRKSLLLEVTMSGRRMEKALRKETQIPTHQRLRDGWSCSKKTKYSVDGSHICYQDARVIWLPCFRCPGTKWSPILWLSLSKPIR